MILSLSLSISFFSSYHVPGSFFRSLCIVVVPPSNAVELYFSYTNEGIRLNDVLLVERVVLYDHCKTIFLNNNVLLLRATPFSGKTSFATLVGRALSAEYNQVINITCLGTESLDRVMIQIGDHSTGAAATAPVIVRLVDVIKQGYPGYSFLIIIDEIQKMYVNVEPGKPSPSPLLWESIKVLQGQQSSCGVRLLLIGAYGGDPQSNVSSTPLLISNTISHDLLRFTHPEFLQLVTKFNGLISINHSNQAISELLPIDQEIADMIFGLTAGHVGLSRFILVQLAQNFLQSSNNTVFPVSTDVMVQYLLSDLLGKTITQTRCVPLEWMAVEGCRNAISAMIRGVDTSYSDMDPVVTYLMKIGILTLTSSQQLIFSSPLLEIIIKSKLFPRLHQVDPYARSFLEFIIAVVGGMNHRLLCTSMSTGAEDLLFEAQLQSEFYRSACLLLPTNQSIFPNVGYMFGSSGYLDFYVNHGKQWGFELTRNSSKLNEHIGRFAPNGRYRLIPFKDWVVINFIQIPNEEDIMHYGEEAAGTTLRGEFRVVYNLSQSIVLMCWRDDSMELHKELQNW